MSIKAIYDKMDSGISKEEIRAIYEGQTRE